MKKIYKISRYMALCAMLGASVSSCDLDVTPPANIATETYWKTAKDAWYNLNNIYSSSIPSIGIYGDAFTNTVYCQYGHESSGSVFQQDGFSASYNSGWGYGLIRKCNIYLANVDRTDLSEALKTRTKAEVRFVRAMEYMNKVVLFGDVPLVLDILDYEAPNVARTPRAQVEEFVLNELKEAAALLPERYEGGEFYEKGRITRYAAHALRARAALYFGDYATAEEAANEVITKGRYSLFKIDQLNAAQQKEADEMSLYVDFADEAEKEKFVKGMFSYESLWHTENATNDNPEYILCRQYMADSWNYQDMVRYTSMRPNQMGGWSSVTPTQNLVDSYWMKDGKTAYATNLDNKERGSLYTEMNNKYLEFKEAYDKNPTPGVSSFIAFVKEKTADGTLTQFPYMEQYRNRDSRMYASIMFPYKSWYETNYGTDFAYQWIKGGNNESKTGFNFRKMLSLEMDPAGNGQATGDFPSIRYAEVLLMYAEARTHNTGYDVEVEKALNQLRDRCGMPNVPSGLGKEAALDLIRRERKIELAAEGFQADDMCRYEDAYWQSEMNGVPIVMPDGEVVITMKWSQRMRLRPVPQGAINNNPLLTQNPGY